jgi:2-dehydro-3-deoxy-D-arabinonate dehydratase
MKLGRVQANGEEPVVFILDRDMVYLTSFSDPLDVLDSSQDVRPEGPELVWEQLLAGEIPGYRLLAPVDPPEVWAYGFTYERGPQFGRSPMIPKGPAYTHAIEAGRPEIFFKTTGSRVVGPNEGIGIRGDAKYTAVEPELCLIVDENAQPRLFTAGNDVSAWDIEAQNPLWLAQCKTYEACCALGPLAVTRDELQPGSEIRCRVLRNSQELFAGSIPINKMHWSFEELANFAAAFNPLPRGTVLMTGTAIIRPDDESLAEGDVVEISIEGVGTLRNTGRQIESKVPFKPYYPG